MKTAMARTPSLGKRVSSRLFKMKKSLYHLSMARHSHNKTVLFIFGCQRSGTSLILEVFDKDLSTKVYGEFSKLSSASDNKLRLNPLDSVKAELDKDKVPLVILKPLVETQNAVKLLNYFEGAKALWMYRHYKDVALSNLQRFGLGNGIKNLRPIVANDPHNWRSEHIPESVREIVLKHFSEDMNPYDAAALFWLVRNYFFFELGLDKHPDVIMCRYNDLVRYPFQTMENIYRFLGQEFPGDELLGEVHSSSVGKGKVVELSSEVEVLCQDFLERLDEVYQQTRKPYVNVMSQAVK